MSQKGIKEVFGKKVDECPQSSESDEECFGPKRDIQHYQALLKNKEKLKNVQKLLFLADHRPSVGNILEN